MESTCSPPKHGMKPSFGMSGVPGAYSRIMLPARRTLSQAVTQALLARIREGEFQPGDRLPTERDLMGEYDIGRNAAREAMQALVALGVADVRPGRGAILTRLDEQQRTMDRQTAATLLSGRAIADLYEFRRVIELEIARLAAMRATEQDIAEIERVVEEYDAAIKADKPISAIDDEFHNRVAAATQNAVFVTMFDAVTELIANSRRLAEKAPWARTRAQVEHRALLEAIRSRDETTAVEVAAKHVESALAAIREGRARVEADLAGDSDPVELDSPAR